MDAFRALLSRTCSPMPVADPEAQPQPQPQQYCAWSTIPVIPHTLNGPNRGSAVSRHDYPPLGSRLPCPEDTPPPYSTYPPLTSRSDPSESATNRTVDGHNYRVYAIVIAIILIIALLATAVYLTFFNHSKV
jgi:hypothetical protein